MATVNLGSIKFKWKGTYSGATAYTVDDVVEYNGSSYICILASTGNLPTNATYFEQMSSAGTNGTNGTDLGTTLTTQGDLVYRDGSGLQRLGAGTSGQFLKTNGSGANPTWAEAGGKFESALFHATSNHFTMTGGTWYDVTMDTVQTNEISGASLSANRVSLPAGTYFIQSFVPFYRVDAFATRLYNITDSALLKEGNKGHSWASPNDATSPHSTVQGRFTLSGTKTVALQYRTDGGASQNDTNFVNIANNLLIWKTA
jgi:hypothetical protein